MGLYKESIKPLLSKHYKRIVLIGIILIAIFWYSVYKSGLNFVLSKIFIVSIAILFNPIFWVSVFGPFIQSFHFLWLRSKLGIGYKAKTVGELSSDLKEAEEELEELRKVLNENKWSYAFNDFSTQLFVTFIAFSFLCLNVLIVITKFYTDSCGTVVKHILFNDTYSLVILITFLVFFVYGIYVLLSGKLISVKILKYYKPIGSITGETRFPPGQSGLTWFRTAITIYSVFYLIWANEQVPKLLELMKQ